MEHCALKYYLILEKYIVTKFKLFCRWYKNHLVCGTFLLILFLILYLYRFIILAEIATPIRCQMWKGKEVEVFMTPEAWRKMTNVEESLKGTQWLYYPTIEGEEEKEPFFIKNKGLYKPIMYFNNNKHYLLSVNNKYPNLNVYTYINPKMHFGHDTDILYDQNLNKIIVTYHQIRGYSTNFLSGTAEHVSCKDRTHPYNDSYKLLERYLN